MTNVSGTQPPPPSPPPPPANAGAGAAEGLPLGAARPSLEEIKTHLFCAGGWQLTDIDAKKVVARVGLRFFKSDTESTSTKESFDVLILEAGKTGPRQEGRGWVDESAHMSIHTDEMGQTEEAEAMIELLRVGPEGLTVENINEEALVIKAESAQSSSILKFSAVKVAETSEPDGAASSAEGSDSASADSSTSSTSASESGKPKFS